MPINGPEGNATPPTQDLAVAGGGAVHGVAMVLGSGRALENIDAMRGLMSLGGDE